MNFWSNAKKIQQKNLNIALLETARARPLSERPLLDGGESPSISAATQQVNRFSFLSV